MLIKYNPFFLAKAATTIEQRNTGVQTSQQMIALFDNPLFFFYSGFHCT